MPRRKSRRRTTLPDGSDEPVLSRYFGETPVKTDILAALSETSLLPRAALNAALAANDRVKYLFSLLQMGMDHAANPEQEGQSLKKERLFCGIDEPAFDTAVAGARMQGKAFWIEGAKDILVRIADAMHVMAAPVIAARRDGFAQRLDTLLATMPKAAAGLLDPEAVSAMTQAGHGGPDSLHQLVMDLHKQLNALQAGLAQETLDGAATYDLADADRARVVAFMAGLNRTARLKFNHPGLATTATRANNRLVIQNDIGTTDAHVIVIHVQDLAVSVTYTDVHPERLAFFKDMLKTWKVAWEGERTANLAKGSAFYVGAGSFQAADEKHCRDYLTFLASRLVFLIDWNRARKQLRGFLRGPDRLALLAWAAEQETGHRGFLEMGGAGLVNQAIEANAGTGMHFGDRLCHVLGDSETLEFLCFVFKACTDGLLGGKSQALIRDDVRVTLASHFSNEDRQLLKLASEHAGLIFEIASLVREGLQAEAGGSGKRTRRARSFEHDADQIVKDTREAVRRRPDFAVFAALLTCADDAADEMEEAVFLLDLDVLKGKPVEELQTLAEVVLEAAQEWVKALGHAGQIGRAQSHAETEDFLAAIDQIAKLEHKSDDAERALTVSAIKHAGDFRQLHLFTAIGGKLEAATDALSHASIILRQHVLEDVIDG